MLLSGATVPIPAGMVGDGDSATGTVVVEDAVIAAGVVSACCGKAGVLPAPPDPADPLPGPMPDWRRLRIAVGSTGGSDRRLGTVSRRARVRPMPMPMPSF